jgi:hypothetical protein
VQLRNISDLFFNSILPSIYQLQLAQKGEKEDLEHFSRNMRRLKKRGMKAELISND